mgnify:CR=1 FL=1
MLVIAGQNDIAVNAAAFLNETFSSEWAVVLNRSDIGEYSWQRSLKSFVEINNIKTINLEEAYQVATTFVSLEFDCIIRLERFQKPVKCFNIHFSLLPKYKGVATSVWPILNGDKKSGVTLHEIDNGIDTGDIIAQREYCLNDDLTAYDIYLKNISLGSSLFIENIDSLMMGLYTAVPQNSVGASYFSKSDIDYSAFKLSFSKTAYQVYKVCRAFTFRPYQLPIFLNCPVVRMTFTNKRSVMPPGKLVCETSQSFKVSTIDYNVILYKCMMHRLSEFSNCDVAQATKILHGLCGIDDSNELGWTPLMVAAYNGNIEVVRMLIDRGANVNSYNIKGTTVLMYAKDFAILSGKKAIFDYLISHGADVHSRDLNGKSIFEYLSKHDKNWLGI